ncbi:wax ester/triacylglycerol synthase family O-acyltransferase [Gordonia alkaliphila]|uniref:WS/DGAT/MGAT family O-acyltransferase n=1 Tax=Gordonia alkaliphila TaxID=1053547 RepID=UPI001FF121A2|nr:wax ester/triacylglycerol synthase family O-acyltransferase [Gordonia alkaliphila]MCK0440347.1 wax ester/triacylglycerol synthase family O-acyltransferase [Gordonia alkaliphila]
MKLLTPLDHAMLRMESARTPMHIGALAIFRLPEDAPDDFVRQVYEAFSALAYLPFPYDSEIAHVPIAVAAYWKKADPDPSYHVRLHALPAPGGEAELGTLVEYLHSRPLDLSRPVWEAHLIEGLSDNRFAFYFKAHHCATDGAAAVETIQSWLSTDPTGLPPTGTPDESPDMGFLQKLTILPRRFTEGTLATAEVLNRVARMTFGSESVIRTAVSTPDSQFNQHLGPHRRVAIENMELATLKEIAKATGAKVNDVMLSIIGGAVRRYLLEQDALPKQSLTASVPIGLTRESDTRNAATGIVAPLGTDIADPLERMKVVAAHTRRGKDDIDHLSRTAQDYFALIGLTPLLIAQHTGLGDQTPTLFNFTVSNVVLGKDKLYLLGAELLTLVPISFLVDGYGLNVTLVGYADTVTLGFVGCRDTLPHLQRLADYTRESMAEMLDAIAERPAREAPPAE